MLCDFRPLRSGRRDHEREDGFFPTSSADDDPPALRQEHGVPGVRRNNDVQQACRPHAGGQASVGPTRAQPRAVSAERRLRHAATVKVCQFASKLIECSLTDAELDRIISADHEASAQRTKPPEPPRQKRGSLRARSLPTALCLC